MPWISLQGRTCGSCSWKCFELRAFSCQLLQELPSGGELLYSRSQPLWDSLPRRVHKGRSTVIWSFCLNAGPLWPAILNPEFPHGTRQGCQVTKKLVFTFESNPTSLPPCHKYGTQRETPNKHPAHSVSFSIQPATTIKQKTERSERQMILSLNISDESFLDREREESMMCAWVCGSGRSNGLKQPQRR